MTEETIEQPVIETPVVVPEAIIEVAPVVEVAPEVPVVVAPVLPYDVEDFFLGETDMRRKYSVAGMHPHYTIAAYRDVEPDKQDLFNGYWDWVFVQIKADEANS